MTDKEKVVALLEHLGIRFEARYNGHSLYIEGPDNKVIGFVEFSFDGAGALTYITGADQ